MKKFRFWRMQDGWAATFFLRFPLGTAAAVAATALDLALHLGFMHVLRTPLNLLPAQVEMAIKILRRLSGNATALLPLALAANAVWTFWNERRNRPRGFLHWAGLAALAAAWVWAVASFGCHFNGWGWWNLTLHEWARIGATGCMAMLAVLLLGGGDFRSGVWRLAATAGKTLLLWGLLSGGVALGAKSVQLLFFAGRDATGFWISVGSIALHLLLPGIAMAQLPRADRPPAPPPVWGEALVRFVLLPLLLLYGLLLAANFLLPGLHPVPRLQAGPIELFCLAGWAAWALLRGERGECRNRRERAFCTAFPWLSILLAAALAVSARRPVALHGLDPRTALDLWLAAWFAASGLWAGLRPRARTGSLALFAAVFLAAASGGPWAPVPWVLRVRQARLLDAMSGVLDRYDGTRPVPVDEATWKRAADEAEALANLSARPLPAGVASAWLRGPGRTEEVFWGREWQWIQKRLADMMTIADTEAPFRNTLLHHPVSDEPLDGWARIWFPENRLPFREDVPLADGLPWTWTARDGFREVPGGTPVAEAGWTAFLEDLSRTVERTASADGKDTRPPNISYRPPLLRDMPLVFDFAHAGCRYRVLFDRLLFEGRARLSDGEIRLVLSSP